MILKKSSMLENTKDLKIEAEDEFVQKHSPRHQRSKTIDIKSMIEAFSPKNEPMHKDMMMHPDEFFVPDDPLSYPPPSVVAPDTLA